MARTDSMATIDAALNAGNMTQQQTAATTSVVNPHVAPGVDTPAPLTSTLSSPAATTKTSANNEQQAIDQLEKKQQQDENAFSKSASQTVNALGNIFKGVSNKFESLPTPGSIILPLVILLVFFMLLIPINGHTRLNWIWLVLTGNAEIENVENGLTVTTIPNYIASNNPSTTVLPNIPASNSMTGVEDL